MIKLIVEILKVIPPILWFSLALTLEILLYRPFLDQLLPNLVGFKAMGVEFSLLSMHWKERGGNDLPGGIA